MKSAWFTLFWQLCLLSFWLFFGSSCRTDQRDKTEQTYQQQQNQSAGKHHRNRHHKQHQNQADNVNRPQPSSQEEIQLGDVPAKVRETLAYIRLSNHPKSGYIGGRTFGNFENHLPKRDASGQKIRYQEWDVNPKVDGQNRGTERLITGSDGRAYYTDDHYNSFTEIK